MLYMIFFTILFLVILVVFESSKKEYFYSNTYELPSLFEKGFTKIDDLKDYTKKIESEYNAETPDLCKDKKIPTGWSYFKKDVDFTTDWKKDDKNKQFYLKHNYTQEESPPFKTESELNENIIPKLPGLHPLVKHTFNIDTLYKLEHNPRRFIRISQKTAKQNKFFYNKTPPITPFEARTQYVYDTKQKKIISNSERKFIEDNNWNDRTKKIYWLRKCFPGHYDKDRVITDATKVHSDSDYNKYISNKLNHLDNNKKHLDNNKKQYHLKLP